MDFSSLLDKAKIFQSDITKEIGFSPAKLTSDNQNDTFDDEAEESWKNSRVLNDENDQDGEWEDIQIDVDKDGVSDQTQVGDKEHSQLKQNDEVGTSFTEVKDVIPPKTPARPEPEAEAAAVAAENPELIQEDSITPPRQPPQMLQSLSPDSKNTNIVNTVEQEDKGSTSLTTAIPTAAETATTHDDGKSNGNNDSNNNHSNNNNLTGQPMETDKDLAGILQANEEEKKNLTAVLQSNQEEMTRIRTELEASKSKITALERKITGISKERDALRRAKANTQAIEQSLKEKDNIISQVMKEGEQLSIKIAERESQIKKLKASINKITSENDAANDARNATQAKLEAALAKLKLLESSEKSAQEAKELAEKKLREMGNESRSLQGTTVALEAARAELDSLKTRQALTLENQAMQLRAEAQAQMDALIEKQSEKEAAWAKANSELCTHLAQVTENAAWKEDTLRRDLEELRSRCQQLETRNEELAAVIPEATKPLLRQVEALQQAAAERAKASAVVEKQQLDRLRDAEKAVALSQGELRRTEEKLTKALGKVASLEEQIKSHEQQQSQHTTFLGQVSVERSKLTSEYEAEIKKLRNELNQVKIENNKALDDLRNEYKASLEIIQEFEERERSKNLQIEKLEEDIFRMKDELRKSQLRVGSLDMDLSSEGVAGIYGHEKLMASLRQKNDEIKILQGQLAIKESATQTLAEEIIALTARIEQIPSSNDSDKLLKEYEQLQKRHQALLVLHGEREEQLAEMEADMEDVKMMYKAQINELLEKVIGMEGKAD